MATPFKISINEPCNEQWVNMQDNKEGKFCSSCQKSVVDFTHFSDNDLKNWFAKNQNQGCGKFNPEQLNRLVVASPTYSIQKLRPGLIAASLLAFLSFPKLSNANTKIIYSTFQSERRPKLLNAGMLNNTIDSIVIIKGKVIAEDDKQALPGAIILINGEKIGSTDDKGYFEIKVNRNNFSNKILMEVRYIGYLSKEINVKLNNKEEIFIKMKFSEAILGGFGMIKEKTFFNKFKDYFNG